MSMSPAWCFSAIPCNTSLNKLIGLFVGVCLMLTLVPGMAAAKQAVCQVTSGDTVVYNARCTFTPGGRGSFSISLPDERDGVFFDEVVLVSVTIISRGVAEVRGLTTAGINSRWGRAVRSRKNRACWDGSDFQICAW